MTNLTATCSGQVLIWLDGDLMSSDHTVKPHYMTLSPGKHLLAISCTSIYKSAAIVWSTSSGYKSDKSSLCSATHEIGWDRAGFRPSDNWGSAETYGTNGYSPLRSTGVQDIHQDAEWIWMGPNYRSDENNHPFITVYCRRYIK